ncbi:MAG TPA: polyprenyl synthetase family protein [Nitrosopumilaceae archaeon]|nr:polyprenyl synthetase family protein [Nitrosopumilaceae archaeon]
MGAEKIVSANSISKTARIVNSFLLSKLAGNPAQLYKAASHLIEHGGKRLRPYMVVKSCEILGGNMKQALAAAASVEMIHNFTLVHDDIMDNDEMRHGVPTVHMKFGIPVGILAGDVLFSKAFEIISSESKMPSKVSTALVSSLSKACVDVCEGQILDIMMAQSQKIPTENQYVTMIEKKTSALFEVSCAMGAICADKKRKDVSNLSSFGKNLGIAFQIVDDLIGIIGDSKITKKPVGNDIREGKKSLPILLAINSANKQDKQIILDAFGNTSVSKNEIEVVVRTIRSMGIEKKVRKKAMQYSNAARKSLSEYDGSAKKELVSLLEFVVERSL